ncbi:MAG: M3 family metallopeptidase [Bryobacteraceae bacterium]|nr:M3 family metallopeptidase [Bryobacteraceae bacterium]
MHSPDNPLIGIRFRIPFDAIRAEHVGPAVRALLAETRERLDAIAAGPSPRTFENTMAPFDELADRLDYAMRIVRHLESVATYPELRAAYNEVQPEVSAFRSSVPLHSGLWRALNEYSTTAEASALTGVRRRFLDLTLAEFRRHGAGLDPAGKQELERMDVELGTLTTRFSQHVLDATNAFELLIRRPEQLAGLPDSAVDAARESARGKGQDGWRFTLQAPSYVAVMTYLDDPAIREDVYRAYNTRAASGEFDNAPLMVRILELRRAKANLLGFRDYADLVLEDRMAKTGDRAQAFLDRLREKTALHFARETAELTAFRRELEGPGAPPLAPWDVGYYAEKLRQARFEFSDEDLRPYFPLDKVLDGLFDLVRRVFGISVVEETGVPAWAPETRYYRIVDDDGTLIGAFYADWYPRENKRGGAWMDVFITGLPSESGFEPHLGLMCGNVNPPVAGKPALLTHREVETVFHEFGHLLHHCLSRVPIRSLAGTHVPWDFVELPSQIMENWCWEREALDLFARHWETGESVPEDLFAKMKRARTFRAASAQMRQLSFGFLDLALHRDYAAERDGDLLAYARRIVASFSPAPLPDDYAMIAAFTHLFADPVGYAAGYYSYKWSEVLDADSFTRFRREGIFNPQTGREFRSCILEKGNSQDPGELYRAFMGREPDIAPLLERLGLASQFPEGSATR